MNETRYKVLTDPITGRILVNYTLSDDRVSLPQSDNLIDITDHPQRISIINNPELHKVIRNGKIHSFVPNDHPLKIVKPLKMVNE